VVAVIAGTILWLMSRPKPAPSRTNTTVVPLVPVDENANAPIRRYQAEIRTDQDGDGLTDAAEQQVQTNPRLADSDGDGLTDAEEANIYKSNPLKQDTDGDGQTDQQEVTAGRNPNGPGLIRDLPASIDSLTNN
jgi:hypothetical protein